MSPGATLEHNDIRDRLNARLRVFVEPRRLGLVTSETDFLLGPATVRRPDVALILAARFAAAYRTAAPVPIAPDLVFEVVSETGRPGGLRAKAEQFLAAGTAAVWLLYPERGAARRWAAARAASGSLLVIEEPELLPGFSLLLADLVAC